MDAATCLEKLALVGVLSVATADSSGAPQVRCVSAIHYESDALYFFTARGKDFCRELMRDGRVQMMAYTRFNEMIRLSGTAKPVSQDEQEHWRGVIFGEQPYLANVYPGESQSIGICFCVKDFSIEYFNLGVHPIFRETYAVGAAKPSPKGYVITDACVGCGTCRASCPQGAIDEGTPYRIRPENCLHCGLCAELCPAQAIEHLGAE